MRTYLDCVPCFFKQALDVSKLCSADEFKQKKVLDQVAAVLPHMKMLVFVSWIKLHRLYQVVRRSQGLF